MRLYISINLNKIFWNFSFPSVDTNHNFSSPALPVNQSCFRFGWQLFVIIWSRVLSLCPLCWSRLIGMIEICSWSGDAFPSRWAMVSLQNCGCVFNTTTWTEFLSQQHRDLTHFKSLMILETNKSDSDFGTTKLVDLWCFITVSIENHAQVDRTTYHLRQTRNYACRLPKSSRTEAKDRE